MTELTPQARERLVLTRAEALDGIIYDLGYEIPKNEAERHMAVAQLLELEGKRAETALLDLLPASKESSHDCFCGCGGLNYTGEMKTREFIAPKEEPEEQPSSVPVGPRPGDPVYQTSWAQMHALAMRWRGLALVSTTAALLLLVFNLTKNG